jgi:hypothetical protein
MMMMKASDCSEKSLYLYQTTRRHTSYVRFAFFRATWSSFLLVLVALLMLLASAACSGLTSQAMQFGGSISPVMINVPEIGCHCSTHYILSYDLNT